MGIFENEVYYDKEEFGTLEFAHQRDVFLKIRTWVASVPLEVRYNNALYRKTILKRIEQIAGYACSGHIPAQDYMGYIYKRGFSTFFPVNYRRGLEWNIIAARNGSKLAPQKMKIFLNPAIDMIVLSPKWAQIIKYNDLNRSNYFWFLSQYVCDILYSDMKLSAVEMAKLPLIEDDSNESRTVISLDKMRDESVRKAIQVLESRLPEDMPEPEYTGKIGEDLFDDEEDGDYDMGVSIENIEDVDNYKYDTQGSYAISEDAFDENGYYKGNDEYETYQNRINSNMKPDDYEDEISSTVTGNKNKPAPDYDDEDGEPGDDEIVF